MAFRELSRQPAAVRKTLTKELHYQADQTCATDGMCQVNCPVNINTGTFVKEIRPRIKLDSRKASVRLRRRTGEPSHHWREEPLGLRG